MNKPLDMLMDEASVLLVKMQYLEAQRLCEEALERAKGAGDWRYVARILLPLQECRRQRRMIAVEGDVLIGSDGVRETAAEMVAGRAAGAVVLTGPDAAGRALAVRKEADKAGKCFEVLAAEAGAGGGVWKIKSVSGEAFEALVEAPPVSWQNRWLVCGAGAKGPAVEAMVDGTTPGSWVVRASEKLGDAGLERVKKAHPRASIDKVRALEVCLESVSDHEFLIQEYQGVARALNLNA